jgi:hypothetical protein
MNLIPRPLVKDDPNNRSFGHKLGKLIATMRRLPEPTITAQAQPAIANGMTAYEDWDSSNDGATKDETEL